MLYDFLVSYCSNKGPSCSPKYLFKLYGDLIIHGVGIGIDSEDCYYGCVRKDKQLS